MSHQNFEFPILITKFGICDYTIEIVLGRYIYKHPEILELVIFAKIAILIMTFISFVFLVNETVLLGEKMSSTLKKR